MRYVLVPADLAAELEKFAQAKAFYESLTEGEQRDLVEPVAEADTDELRQRRIAKVISTLQQRQS